MSGASRFILHRPELSDALVRGEDKIRVLTQGQTRAVAAGATLIEADADHPFVYRLREGWVGRVRTLPDGRAQYILVFLPGDLFAMKSMFVTCHPDAVQALSDAVVEPVHYRKLREAYDADPDIATRFTWQVVEEERRLHNWVVGLGRGDADERMAQMLLDFRGRLALTGRVAADGAEYDLPMTQEQIGDHLGISAVHVNRVLKSFRESGLAVMQRQRVRILDVERLAAVASPLLDTYERTAIEVVGKAAGVLDPRDRERA